MIIDTHAHYDDEAFEEDRGALIASLAEQGIGRVVNVAADLASVSTSLTLAQQYPFIYAAVGVHPSNVQELTERDYEWLEEKLAAPKAVAVGEIGLDYYWDKEPEVQARQRESFSRQLQLAKKLDKPVIIHSRDAAKDTLDVMAAEGGSQLRAVIHCFSYTKETAREFQKWDYYFGIGGVLTFKNAKKLKEAAAELLRPVAESSLKKAMAEGDLERGAVMAGQVVALVKEERTSLQIIDDAIAEAKEILVHMNEFEF